MLAIFTNADAVVLAGTIPATIAAALSWANARKAERQTRPNGGSSLRDVVDRIETSLSDEVLPRLDRGANRLAEHDDRLAVLEQRTAHHGPGSGR